MKPVVIGLGNELFGDDGFGLLAARRLAGMISESADVIECRAAGLELIDPLVGRPLAVIIDVICTGRNEPGTIYRVGPAELRSITNLSPHYAGLPEVLRTARQLALPLPEEIVILAVEARDIHTMGGGLSPEVAEAMESVVKTVVDTVLDFQKSHLLIA